jgi:hypothetical protein
MSRSAKIGRRTSIGGVVATIAIAIAGTAAAMPHEGSAPLRRLAPKPPAPAGAVEAVAAQIKAEEATLKPGTNPTSLGVGGSPPVSPATGELRRAAAGGETHATLISQLALARLATAKYVSDLGRAKEAGYRIITRMIPDMGYHYMNTSVKGFDVRKPPILVYEHHGSTWQLGALEWVYTAKPKTPPLPGAKYGTFGAGCHYFDGTFVPRNAQASCPRTSPQTGAAFSFWHPLLFTLHVWLWYPNPSGLFASTNPLVAVYNNG